jgi:type II secretory pathway pseudopilin PulG
MASPITTYHRQSNRSSGFTLIEVLIATLIMVVSIITVTAALRQFSINREQLRRYEQLHITTLSLRDKIMSETLTDNRQDKGTLNGLDYNYVCHLDQTATNSTIGGDMEQSGIKGPFLVMLFKVSLEVGGKTFEFYKTQYKKRSENSNDEEF